MCDKTDPHYECCGWDLSDLDLICAEAWRRFMERYAEVQQPLEPPADISWATFETP
jgi:hypothetical protein